MQAYQIHGHPFPKGTPVTFARVDGALVNGFVSGDLQKHQGFWMYPLSFPDQPQQNYLAPLSSVFRRQPQLETKAVRSPPQYVSSSPLPPSQLAPTSATTAAMSASPSPTAPVAIPSPSASAPVLGKRSAPDGTFEPPAEKRLKITTIKKKKVKVKKPFTTPARPRSAKTKALINRTVRVISGKATGQIGVVVRSGHGFYGTVVEGYGELMKRAAELEIIDDGHNIGSVAPLPARETERSTFRGAKMMEAHTIKDMATLLVDIRHRYKEEMKKGPQSIEVHTPQDSDMQSDSAEDFVNPHNMRQGHPMMPPSLCSPTPLGS